MQVFQLHGHLPDHALHPEGQVLQAAEETGVQLLQVFCMSFQPGLGREQSALPLARMRLRPTSKQLHSCKQCGLATITVQLPA